ncbi:MAG: hypothetical protein KJP04_05975 [Arenicella sp.]|nr:hypothetical protein [Arenicella sp.]
MNTKNYLIASIAGGTFILFYGFIVNAILLADFWSNHGGTALMRPEGTEIMWAIVASCYLQGFILTCIYIKGMSGTGIMEGLRFGLLIAAFVASIYLLFYGLQPWGLDATVVTMLVDGVMFIGAGLVIAALYK